LVSLFPVAQSQQTLLEESTNEHGQQSLLQALTKFQKTDSIAEQSATRTSNKKEEPVDSTRPKFFLASHHRTCEPAAFPKTIVDPGKNGTLGAFSDWLWVVHDETGFDEYVRHRLACSNSLVQSVAEADLCYPSCTSSAGLASIAMSIAPQAQPQPQAQLLQAEAPSRKRVDKLRWMPSICFEVQLQKRQNWLNCSKICLQPEAGGYIVGDSVHPKMDGCAVEVPYLHGIVWPEQSHSQSLGVWVPENQATATPWEFEFPRTSLLTFVGGEHRGVHWREDRDGVIKVMQNEASRINAVSPQTVFSAHIIQEPKEKIHENDWYSYGRTPAFYLDTWQTYASASFSWHPHGDTPTRRAVYDSLMFGCIPVIDSRSAPFYRNLFKGTLWKDVAMEDVFVVIPRGDETNGLRILQLLTSLTVDEVAKRRSSLRKVASALQWGEHSTNGGDAFAMALRSFSRS